MADISKITLPSGQTYDIKDAVARQAISEGLEIRVVSTLPTASAETMGALYLVPNAGKGENVKDEYVTYKPTSSTYAWEKIGTTEIDLSPYAKKGDGVTVTLNNNVSGTGVSAHSASGSLTNGTTTADGTNQQSSVSFASSSISASKIKTAGSVSAGTATTPASIDTTKFNGGSPTTVTLPTFSQGTDNFNNGSLPNLTTTVSDEVLSIGWNAGALPTFTQGTDSWTAGSVTKGSAASLGTGFYTPGSKGTPTAVTLPTFDSVPNLVDTSNSAVAAAQVFTGKPSSVTGTINVSVEDHTVTQGKVTGSASGTINN